MNKRLGMTYTAAALAMAAMPAAVWADAGTTGAALLQYDFSPRAEAMGQAFVAVSDDLQAMYWNPAGLTSLPGGEIGATFARGLVSDYYGQVAAAFPATGQVAVGGGLIYYDGGTFDWVDGLGTVTQVNAQRDFLINATGAVRLSPVWSLGLTAELLTSTLLEEVSGTTVSFTAGALIQPVAGAPFRLGAVLRHLGAPLSYGGSGSGDPLPLSGQFGAAVDVLAWSSLRRENQLTLAVDGVWVRDDPFGVNVGGEYWFRKQLALRAGYKFNRDLEGATLGAGLKLPLGVGSNAQIDYSYSFSQALDGLQKLALTVIFP